jgi:deoxycytidylate deaminase
MATELATGINVAYGERSDFVVVALTGRTGSGCTTAAKVLSSEYTDISLAVDEAKDLDARKLGIVNRFAASNWVPFHRITVSSVIWSFVLEVDWLDVERVIEGLKLKNANLDGVRKVHERCRGDSRFKAFRECMSAPTKAAYPSAWDYYKEVVEPAGSDVKRELSHSYAPIFQLFGDNLRLSGKPHTSGIKPAELFSLIRRVKLLAKASFYAGKAKKSPSVRVVVDAIRNPLEMLYLRDQFATFYCVAITVDDVDRVSRLMNSGVLTRVQIDAMDAKEYGSKSLKDYGSFVSQNLKECIQKSDLFVTNPGSSREFDQSVQLNRQLVSYVALMLRPGLITPTRDERCMQLAFVAKLNSGCISRQVGAAVADSNYSIKAVGWNDVAKGQVSCALRDVNSLLTNSDSIAFSDYEKSNKSLRDHLGKKFANRGVLSSDQGLHCPFCFKDAYNESEGKKRDNQVHTRALHAEENAFLQLAKSGSGGIEGGVLYTTASPCELCSKKAYQLGITEVIYVDPYPGISADHILGSGPDALRPKLRLFSGAIGHAYHRLYDPSMPIKDEYEARLTEDPQPGLFQG